MAKKTKHSDVLMPLLAEAFNEVFKNGLAAQRLQQATEEFHQQAALAQAAVNKVTDFVMTPDKKDMN